MAVTRYRPQQSRTACLPVQRTREPTLIETGSHFSIDLTVVTLIAFVVGMMLEIARPARHSTALFTRWMNNGSLALLTYLSNYLLFTVIATAVLYRIPPADYAGLSALPLWAQAGAVFLAIEFTRYLVHLAMHRVLLLWRFHAVHHADSEVDISTSFRHHPLEAALSGIPLTALVALLAAAPEVFIAYRAFDLVVTVMTHTNVDIPERLDRWLRYLVVTPAFHRTHHMARRRFTDSNYGASFPWFDYLFGTHEVTTSEQQRSEQLGLDTHTRNEQRLDGMLYAPFVPRRADP